MTRLAYHFFLCLIPFLERAGYEIKDKDKILSRDYVLELLYVNLGITYCGPSVSITL